MDRRKSPPDAEASRVGRSAAATRLGLAGPGGARLQGALLRRLLASGDWLALIATLAGVTATSRETDVGVLFWATMLGPVWLLTVKLHGLYDNDHRRIRHSTLDELPRLVSAAALGTLALDGVLSISPAGALPPTDAIAVGGGALVGSFVARGVVRFFWHRLAGPAVGLVIGPPSAVSTVARRVATHPEARMHLVGYLAVGDGGGADSGGLPRLGTVDDIAAVAHGMAVERVIVTEDQMSEPAAERLIEECKAAGLGLT
ncbi:MAG TPA: hypothetical protein VHF50_00520, partial [Solirubrobacterales bacterium]|nr:hypothetical protein [Solirubrobacterales bacterium]